MKRKVMSRDYSSIDEFADDAKLISSNCLAYNNRSKRYIEVSMPLHQPYNIWSCFKSPHFSPKMFMFVFHFSFRYLQMAVHFKQAWEHFREHAVQRYPTITAKSLTSTRVEIPSMDRGYYINDEPEGEDEAIELPYILTPQQIRQAVDAEMVDLHSGPGLRVIMNLVLGYMEMLDDQGQFASPVCNSSRIFLSELSTFHTHYTLHVNIVLPHYLAGVDPGLSADHHKPHGFRHDACEG